MRLIFWQGILSPHQNSYIRALASRAGWDVTVVAERRMRPERTALGWTVPDFGAARLRIASETPGVLALDQYPPEAIHIVEGVRGVAMVRRMLPLLYKRSAHLGIIFESGDASGLKGWLRRIVYTRHALASASRIDFVLAMGAQGVNWYRKCLFPESRIYRFAYVAAPAVPRSSDVTIPSVKLPGVNFPGNDDAVTLGFLGALIPRKGGDLLLRALAALPARNWQLMIVGDGESRAAWESLAVQLGLSDRVTFTGVVSNQETRAILSGLDLFVLPSRFDGWGVVVNEALMQGVPVLCSDRCGARDLLLESWRGEAFAAGSVESLRAALATWIHRGKKTRDLSERIRRWSGCIEGDSIADYFVRVLGHVYHGAPRPLAPWLPAGPAAPGRRSLAMTNSLAQPGKPAELRPAANPPADAPRVVILVGYYLPGYKAGGPIRSIENLVGALGGEFRFQIATGDRDLGDEHSFPEIAPHQWLARGSAHVLYLQAGLRGFLRLYQLLRSLDPETVLYVNSFFAPRYSILPVVLHWLKISRPRSFVLAPRGEFSRGALGHSRWRKPVYLWISRTLGLHDNLMWQASSPFEAADIRRQFPSARSIAIAPVMPGRSEKPLSDPGMRRRPKPAGELRAVFVSRVSRKKNLAGAIEMLSALSGTVSFDIYGPAEDLEYFAECQNAIASLPPNIHAHYCGQVEHAEIGRVFADHDLFLFPTLGENYGHVICEALVAGCPVLISDQTPWRDLETAGVGWDLPLDGTARFRAALQQCVDGGEEWHAALSARAAEYGTRHATNPETIDANRRLFQNL